MPIGTAYLLPGATMLDGADSGFFETYRGIIETPTGKVSAYVKLLGPKALVNEVLCTALGQASGLPIPDGYLVNVSAKDYPHSQFLRGQGMESTLAYGSANANAPTLARRFNITCDSDENVAYNTLLRLWAGWRAAMVFDEWIANADRHRKNLLIGAQNVVWLIDHSHAFTGPNWHFRDLRPTAYTKNQIAIHVERALSPKDKYTLRKFINELISQYKAIPKVDIVTNSVATKLLSDDELDALKTFISERVDKLPDLLLEHIGMPTLYAVSS